MRSAPDLRSSLPHAKRASFGVVEFPSWLGALARHGLKVTARAMAVSMNGTAPRKMTSSIGGMDVLRCRAGDCPRLECRSEWLRGVGSPCEPVLRFVGLVLDAVCVDDDGDVVAERAVVDVEVHAEV